MAENILTTSIQAPGFMGINTQDSPIGLDNGFSTVANNCIIDKLGRIGSRKGWTPAHGYNSTLGASSMRTIHELIDNSGVSFIIAAGATKLFKLTNTVLNEITYGGGGTAPVITNNNWQAASLNGCLYLYQAGHNSLVFDPAVSTTTYRRVSEKIGYLGTVQDSNTVISAYGRTWSANTATNKSTIQFSDLLSGHVLTTGTAGTLNVSTIWPMGNDEIISLAAHNGFLIIFGRRQTLVYKGADTPSTMSLADAISGTGCYARDSVVVTGGDVLFLSDSGVKSLMRTIQEKSMPLRDISANVRDDIISAVAVEAVENIKAVYSDVDSFYLLSLPASGKVFCFDMRTSLQNGAARTTTWHSSVPTGMFYTRDKRLLMGNPSYIGVYGGYSDNGANYTMSYYTNYFDFQAPTNIKMLKKVSMTIIGGNGATISVKYAFDYVTSYFSKDLVLGSVGIAEYGIAEYNIGQYTSSVVFSNKQIIASGAGNVLQLGLETVIKGAGISLQKLDCYVKQGRTR